MNDIERIIRIKQHRLDELSRPDIWEAFTKNMESGELREFKQSCIDDEIIIAALRAQQEIRAATCAIHDCMRRLEKISSKLKELNEWMQE